MQICPEEFTMKCQNCGNECADSACFCTECGTRFESVSENKVAEKPAAPVNDTSRPEQPARPAVDAKGSKRWHGVNVFGTVTKRTLIVAASTVLVLLLAAVLLLALVNHFRTSSGYTTEVSTRYAAPTPSTLADSEGRIYDLSEYGVVSYEIYTSLDGRTAAILGYCNAEKSESVLLLLYRSALSKIADGAVDCAVSDNGAAIAYTLPGTDTCSLYLYDTKSKTSTLISGGIPTSIFAGINLPGIYMTHGAFVLSPDGRSIAFTKQVNGDGRLLYVSVKGSEPVAVAADSYPVALSNGGKYIYYIRNNVSLTEYNFKFSVTHGDDVRNLSLDAAHLGDIIIFNADRTEVVFYDNGSTYISRKAGERQKITGAEITALIVPGDGAARSEYLDFAVKKISVYARKTVAGSAFVSGGGLYYLNRGLEISCITSQFGGCSVSPNGKAIYYIDTTGSRNAHSGKVYYLDSIEKTGDKKLISGDLEATEILAPDKFDGVYLRDIDDTLWFVTSNGKKQKRIADELYLMNVDVKGGGVYFTTELEDSTTVWYSKRGSKKKAVIKAELAGVESVNFMPRHVFFRTYEPNGTGEVNVTFCRITSGKKYEQVFEYTDYPG